MKYTRNLRCFNFFELISLLLIKIGFFLICGFFLLKTDFLIFSFIKIFLKKYPKFILFSFNKISSSFILYGLNKRLYKILNTQINGKINGLIINFITFISFEFIDETHRKIRIDIKKVLIPTIA